MIDTRKRETDPAAGYPDPDGTESLLCPDCRHLWKSDWWHSWDGYEYGTLYNRERCPECGSLGEAT